MSLSLEHVVIRMQDLERAITLFSTPGVRVQRSGTHADGATHDALIGFADGSDFEPIAFPRDAPGHRRWDAGHGVGARTIRNDLPQQMPAGFVARPCLRSSI